MTTLQRLLALLAAVGMLAGFAPGQDDEPSIEVDAEPEAGADPPPERERATQPEGAAPARKPGAKPKYVAVQDRTKRFTIRLPDDWRLTEDARVKEAPFNFQVTLPGSNRAYFLVEPLQRMGDPRSCPLRYRENAEKSFEASQVVPGWDPLPHLVADFTRDGDAAKVIWVFLRPSGHGFLLRLECLASDFEFARADALAAAASFEAKLEPHPPVPRNYKTIEKGPFVLASHPAVTGSVDNMLKVAAKHVKKFQKVHGKLPRRDAPAVIYVHNDKFQAKPILEAVADSKSEWYVDSLDGRVFVAPFHENDRAKESEFVGAVHALLYVLRYGTTEPLWVYTGEHLIARAEHHANARLPKVAEGYDQWTAVGLLDLDALPDSRSNWEVYYKNAFCWVAAMRAGPGSCRKPYKKFLADYADACDWEGLTKKHFGDVDMGKLKRDVGKWIATRIKTVKPAE